MWYLYKSVLRQHGQHYLPQSTTGCKYNAYSTTMYSNTQNTLEPHFHPTLKYDLNADIPLG